MKLVGAGNQGRQDFIFDASGVVGTGPLLVLPRAISRSFLLIQNVSGANMAVEFGGARIAAQDITVTNGVVTSVAITNANVGFGYKAPPLVRFWGGGYDGNTAFNSVGAPDYPSPPKIAKATATIHSGALTGIVLESGGLNYAATPMCYLVNSDLDPYGAAIPAIGSSGITLTSNGPPLIFNGTACPTDAVSIIASANNSAFICKWMN